MEQRLVKVLDLSLARSPIPTPPCSIGQLPADPTGTVSPFSVGAEPWEGVGRTVPGLFVY